MMDPNDIDPDLDVCIPGDEQLDRENAERLAAADLATARMQAAGLVGYQSPPGFHRHRCASCGAIWEHKDLDGWETPPIGHSHSCPRPGCSDFQIFRYNGPEPPTRFDS